MFIYYTFLCIDIPVHWASGLSKWVECSPIALESGVHSQVDSYQSLKNGIDTSLLNTQNYKVRNKGKMELSSERFSALPYSSV